MFDLNTASVPANSGLPHIDTSEVEVVTPTHSLPPIADLGSGICKELRPASSTKHKFVVIGAHGDGNTSVALTSLMLKASPECKDIQVCDGFGVFQATSPGFAPNERGTEYVTGRDKQIYSDGGSRIINTMVLPKAQVERAFANDATPAQFKSAFVNFDVAPQGELNDLTVQFGMPIVKFHISPGKKAYPQVGEMFKIADFVVPAKIIGPKSNGDEKDRVEYHAGGAMGILPFHTISVDKLEILGRNRAPRELAELLATPAYGIVNLAVLASSPKVTLTTLPAARAQHDELVSNSTSAHNALLAAALKPTLCNAATVGKPESRAVFVEEKDVAAWARHIGTAANDATSCNIGRVANMLCLTTDCGLTHIAGSTSIYSKVMTTAVEIMKDEFAGKIDTEPIISTTIAKFAERLYADAKLGRAGARGAPKIMEFKIEVAVATSESLKQFIDAGTPPGGIAKMEINASLMTNHVTGSLGVDDPKLSTALFQILKPFASITLVGSLAQNMSGMNLTGQNSDKAKETLANQRAIVKEIGVTELNLINSPENVILNIEPTLAFALKLSSEFVKSGLGMMGGGDFVSETKGTITDAIEISCKAAQELDEEEAVKYKRRSTYTKPKCFAGSNLKLAKDAAYACINQDGATDIRGTVYAFVLNHDGTLKENHVTEELLEQTSTGEETLSKTLGLNGTPGELIGKVNHGAVFLFQKRFAPAATGGIGAAIAVHNDPTTDLDFSYMMEDALPPAPPSTSNTVAEGAPPAKKPKKK